MTFFALVCSTLLMSSFNSVSRCLAEMVRLDRASPHRRGWAGSLSSHHSEEESPQCKSIFFSHFPVLGRTLWGSEMGSSSLYLRDNIIFRAGIFHCDVSRAQTRDTNKEADRCDYETVGL